MRNEYLAMITFVDKALHVHVSCSCDDLTYRYEFSNSLKNAGEIEYSNGEPSDITNPLYKPSLCKHLYQLYLKIQPKLPPGT